MADVRAGETVAIVGAGIAGICVALELKRRGVTDFVIYDREDGVGGVWYQNAYPGCRSDVAAVHYSHSRYPNTAWTETHPPRPEIQQYWQSIVDEQGLSPHIRHLHTHISSTWEPSISSYLITLNTPNGQQTVSHRFLISAIGGFSKPRWPEVDVGGFKGTIFHSGQWPRQLGMDEMKWKKVVVVGNGCSGAQIVATLAKDPEIGVVTLARSHQWLVPGPTPQGPATRKFERFEKYLRSYKLVTYLLRIQAYLGQDTVWGLFEKKSWIRPVIQWYIAKWMKKSAPNELKDRIVPPFPIGGKRIEVDCGYLYALNKPNVTPIWDGLEKVTSDGLITNNGQEIKADYIVLATGFDLGNALDVKSSSISTKGNRQHLQYYHGTAVHGLPNFFTLMGNNVHPLTLSQVFMYEVQAGYIGQMISGCMNSGIKYVQVRKGPTTAYNSWLEKRLRNTVLVEAQSYMRSEGGTGRVFAPWPGPGYLFWWHNRTVEWGDYIGADKMADAQVFRRRVTNAGLATLISLLLWRYRLTLSATYRCVWS